MRNLIKAKEKFDELSNYEYKIAIQGKRNKPNIEFILKFKDSSFNELSGINYIGHKMKSINPKFSFRKNLFENEKSWQEVQKHITEKDFNLIKNRLKTISYLDYIIEYYNNRICFMDKNKLVLKTNFKTNFIVTLNRDYSDEKFLISFNDFSNTDIYLFPNTTNKKIYYKVQQERAILCMEKINIDDNALKLISFHKDHKPYYVVIAEKEFNLANIIVSNKVTPDTINHCVNILRYLNITDVGQILDIINKMKPHVSIDSRIFYFSDILINNLKI